MEPIVLECGQKFRGYNMKMAFIDEDTKVKDLHKYNICVHNNKGFGGMFIYPDHTSKSKWLDIVIRIDQSTSRMLKSVVHKVYHMVAFLKSKKPFNGTLDQIEEKEARLFDNIFSHVFLGISNYRDSIINDKMERMRLHMAFESDKMLEEIEEIKNKGKK